MAYSKTKKERFTKKDFEKAVVEKFLTAIENSDNPYEWQRDWAVTGGMKSLSTGQLYHGINAINLFFSGLEKKYTCNTWGTFNKIKELFPDAHLPKGEKSTRVMYTGVYDKNETERKKANLSFAEMDRLIEKEGRNPDDFSVVTLFASVFNLEQWQGIPDEVVHPPIIQNENIKEIDYVNQVIHGLGLDDKVEHGGDRACYIPSKDMIRMPERTAFNSDYGYNATLLHELGHATGASKRLNRDCSSYAREELVAELTSAMTSRHIIMDDEVQLKEYEEQHMKNHQAYWQSWGAELRDDPSILTGAIKQAEIATDFMDVASGEMTPKRFEELHKGIHLEIDNGVIVRTIVDNKDNINQTFDTSGQDLASRLVDFVKDYDPYNYMDNIGYGETDEDVIENLRESLTDSKAVSDILDYLNSIDKDNLDEDDSLKLEGLLADVGSLKEEQGQSQGPKM